MKPLPPQRHEPVPQNAGDEHLDSESPQYRPRPQSPALGHLDGIRRESPRACGFSNAGKSVDPPRHSGDHHPVSDPVEEQPCRIPDPSVATKVIWEKFAPYCENLAKALGKKKVPMEVNVRAFLSGLDQYDNDRASQFAKELAAEICAARKTATSQVRQVSGVTDDNDWVHIGYATKGIRFPDHSWKYYLSCPDGAAREAYVRKVMTKIAQKIDHLQIECDSVHVKCGNFNAHDTIVGHAGSLSDLQSLVECMNDAHRAVQPHTIDRLMQCGRPATGVDTIGSSESQKCTDQVIRRYLKARDGSDRNAAIAQISTARGLAMLAVGLDPYGTSGANLANAMAMPEPIRMQAMNFLLNHRDLPEDFFTDLVFYKFTEMLSQAVTTHLAVNLEVSR